MGLVQGTAAQGEGRLEQLLEKQNDEIRLSSEVPNILGHVKSQH